MPVFYGIDTRLVSRAKLLTALAAAAREFDEPVKTMVAVVSDTKPICWFTVRCSKLPSEHLRKERRGMASEYFSESFAAELGSFVMLEIDETLSNIRSLRAFGRKKLHTLSNGGKTLVVAGRVAKGVERSGDAIDFGLRAIGWPTDPTWTTLVSKSTRFVLRKDGKAVARPRSVAGTRLPTVRVLPSLLGPGGPSFAELLGLAKEQYDLSAAPLKPPAATRSGAKQKPVRVDVNIGRGAAMPDLGGAARLVGKIQIIDEYAGDEWGLKVLDLSGVEELVSPFQLTVGPTTEVRAPDLVAADGLMVTMESETPADFSRLKTMRWGTLRGTRIVLPALEEIKRKVTIAVEGSFHVELPELRKGNVVIEMFPHKSVDKKSVFHAPKLPAANVTFNVRGKGLQTIKAVVRRGCAR
jgi:hypothetical protein